jgi:superfamily II DNA or RNA helicase
MSTDTTPEKTSKRETVTKLTPEMRALLRADKKARKGEAAREVLPLAFKLVPGDGWNPDDPAAYSRSCIAIHPVVDPLFDALMIEAGATRVGSRTYIVGLGKDSSWSLVKRVFEIIPPLLVWGGECAKDIDKVGVAHAPVIDRLADIKRNLVQTPLGKGQTLSFLQGTDYVRTVQPREALAKTCVVVDVNEDRMYLRVATSRANGDAGLFVAPDTPDLNVLQADGSRREPVTTTPDRALTVAESLLREGYRVVNDDLDLDMLRDNMRDVLVAQPCDGSPGRSRFVVGGNIKRVPGLNLGPYTGDARVTYVDAQAAGTIINRARKRRMQAFAHPAVDDIGLMATCKPVDFPLARPYQKQAVGLHLATNLGYLNASSPGLGKTVMTLQAMRIKAGDIPGYRGLIVVPANIRSQWLSEVEKFWPDVHVRVFHAKGIAEDFKAWHSAADVESGLAIVSYNTATDALKTLQTLRWHDLAVDEAAFLKNASSKRSKSIWKLRSSADVAVALTGTPIEKDLDDLGSIVAWVRADNGLFRGRKLSKRFNIALPGHTAELWEHLGPTVFRRDRSEIADELPAVTTETVILDPEPAELRLAEGARRELKKIYERLNERLEEAEKADPDNPKFKELREDIRSMRGAVLGGIPLARMAASDPHAVAESDSMAVALLDGKGLVEPAVKTGGTKRKTIGALVQDLAARNEAVLVFTDFERCAKNLVSDLEAAGVRVGLFSGSMPIKKRDKNKDMYQAGELDVLVLTGAGREGHNLQRTSVIIHYDLGWKATELEQRIGRSIRIGATGSHVSNLIPIMAGTIEERVASVIIRRALIALEVLDNHRGVDMASTGMGQAMQGLAAAVSDDEREGDTGIWDMARTVFGS